MVSTPCAHCGSVFTYDKSGPGRLRKWCSESCRLKAYRDRCADRRTPCLDCGQPSWGERCRSCSSAARCVGPVPNKRLCECGALRSYGAKRCMACWHKQIQRPEGQRRKRVWVPYISDMSLSSSRWRRIREQVITEEPNCRIAIPGTCTGVSDTADHIIPRSIRPDLMFVRSNLRGACHACNSKLGNGGIARRRLTITPACLAIPGLGHTACRVCGGDFQQRQAAHKYCGAECRRLARKKRQEPRMAHCALCASEFLRSNLQEKYCTDDCRAEVYARRMRDRYRAAHGLPVDPNVPTKSYGRRRLWRDADQPRKTLASAAA